MNATDAPEADVRTAEEAVSKVPLVKMITDERYYARRQDGASWNLDQPMTRAAAEEYLIEIGVLEPRDEWDRGPSPLAIAATVPNICIGVMGFECSPKAPPLIVEADGKTYLANTWVPPSIDPATNPEPGEWPNLRRVLLWLAESPEGLEWLLDWVAFKVQRPDLRPGTGVLLQGPPGSGKNVFFRVMSLLLGWENCIQIGEADLAKPYNAHYAGKLLIFANELISNHRRTLSLNDGLKAVITDEFVTIEAKGAHRFRLRNRAAVLAATNHSKPLEVESNDRRWTVFHNRTAPGHFIHADLQRTHRDFLWSLHVTSENDLFTPAFMAEVRAFAFEMSQRAVNHERVRLPFENDAREELLQLSESATEQFLRELVESDVPEGLLSSWINRSKDRELEHAPRMQRIAGTKAFTNSALYAALVGFCNAVGQKQVPHKRTFLSALRAAGWREVRKPALRGHLPPWCPDEVEVRTDPPEAH